MTKATHGGPTATTINDDSIKVTDIDGREICYRPLDLVEEYDLSRALGKDSNNEAMRSLASLAAGVRTIDGHPRPFPQNEGDIRAALKTVGNKGVEALSSELIKRAQAAASDDQVQDEVKN